MYKLLLVFDNFVIFSQLLFRVLIVSADATFYLVLALRAERNETSLCVCELGTK